MEFFRDQLRLIVADAAACGAQNYKIDGLFYCIQDGVLTTVLTKEQMEQTRAAKFDSIRKKGGGRRPASGVSA
jgi:hypothetical protein